MKINNIKDCNHDNIEWNDEREDYNESLAFYGKCNDCDCDFIELWSQDGVYKRDSNNNPIGERM